MLAFGVRSDGVNVGGVNVDVKLRNAIGVFEAEVQLRPAEVFARVGYARVKVRATACVAGVCASDSDSDGDIAWGFGANYNINPRMYVGADWMRLNDDDGGKVIGPDHQASATASDPPGPAVRKPAARRAFSWRPALSPGALREAFQHVRRVDPHLRDRIAASNTNSVGRPAAARSSPTRR